MAGKKKTTTVTTEETALENPVEIEHPVLIPGGKDGTVLEPAEEDLRKFFSDVGDGAIVKVYKYETSTNRPNFRCDTDIENATESWIQEHFGPGRYSLRAYLNGEYQGGRTVYIGAGIVVDKDEPVAPAIPSAPAGMDPLLQMQMEKLKQDATDNRAILLKLIDKLGETGSKSSLTELTEAMTVFKALNPGSDQTSILKVIGEAIPLIKQLMDMGGGSKGPSEDKGWIGLARDALNNAPTLLRGFAAMRSRSIISQPENLPENEPSQLEAIDEQTIQSLKAGIAFLKTRALKGTEPGIFVDYVMSTLDDNQSVMLASLIEKPYDEIAKLDKDLLNPVYRPWFEKFFLELKREIQSLHQSDSGSGDNGDTDNLAGNETAGPVILPDGPAD